ncbi:hypothetical protein D9Q98_006239 [Chlorella vulgaris]|uniref:Nudix hydrolase domain-containing protein n=1 Tax=Chlorella vulgaris TaxID=3077 RepID=A0A9D4Z0P5_CHLVU|nr:hypothetical protein D9Q98_006239 [Chlorella vulgaris]
MSSTGGQHQTDRQQNGAAAEPAPLAAASFKVVGEDVIHARYLTLYNRAVQFPPSTPDAAKGPVHEFDVIGHPQAEFHYAVVFPYHSADSTVTLVREYAQGPHCMVWCLPTGAYDPRKHADYQGCARAEMSEEAQLAGGTWVPLMPEGHPGIPEVKWCRNRFHAYLVIDPRPDEQPGQRDKEELIEVCRVGLPELRELMMGGEMLLPSITTCYMALERIRELQRQERGS